MISKAMWSLVRAADSSINLIAKRVYSVLPFSNPSNYNLKVVRNIDYNLPSTSPFHKLDAYYTPNGRPKPVVMYVHGGGFATLSKDTHQVMALNFAARGYQTFAINYRLSPESKFPASLEDCIEALIWVEENADRFNGDPNNIILAGESAGANLVAALALAFKTKRKEKFVQGLYEMNLPISAVIPVYGLLNLNNMERFHHPPLSPSLKFILKHCARAYIGKPCSKTAAEFPLASPLEEIKKLSKKEAESLPPFFIPCGTADPLFKDSKDLHKALGSLGVTSTLSTHPNQIHGFNIMVWKKAAQNKWKEVELFLNKYKTTLTE